MNPANPTTPIVPGVLSKLLDDIRLTHRGRGQLSYRMNIRLPEDIGRALEDLERMTGEPRTFHLERALRLYLEILRSEGKI